MKMSRSFAVISRSLMFAIARQAEGCSAQDDLAQPSAANMASPYVPLDRGVYSGFELLAAKGYVRSASFNLRPWIFPDCARLLQEAEELAPNRPVGDDTAVTLLTLKTEFVPELERRFPLLWSQPHRNDEFTVQPSNSPMGRTK
jgi:hypothetical protein